MERYRSFHYFIFLSVFFPPARPPVRPSVRPSLHLSSLCLCRFSPRLGNLKKKKKKKKEESVFLQVRKLQLELDMETQQAGSK